jgi:CRISPR-associated exonuclease Cas4
MVVDEEDLAKKRDFTNDAVVAKQHVLVAHDGIMVSAEDVRQFEYCKRILYFRYVIRARPPNTYKMDRGEAIHERRARRYDYKKMAGDQETERYFNVRIESPYYGLFGVLDAFEFDGKQVWPVEIKTGNVPLRKGQNVYRHHALQLAAQALLLEEMFCMPIKHGKVLYVDGRSERHVEITFDEKLEVLNIISEIQDIISLEKIPAPTMHEGKCQGCEYWFHCMRV